MTRSDNINRASIWFMDSRGLGHPLARFALLYIINKTSRLYQCSDRRTSTYSYCDMWSRYESLLVVLVQSTGERSSRVSSLLEGTKLYGKVLDFSLSRANFTLLNLISTDDLLKDSLLKESFWFPWVNSLIERWNSIVLGLFYFSLILIDSMTLMLWPV